MSTRLLLLLSLSVLIVGRAPAGESDAQWQFTVPGRMWYVATTGDDQHAGTRAQPLRSIQRGAELAQPGDAVLVDAGIYRERVTPPRSGEKDRPIVFKARPGATVVISGAVVWNPPWRDAGDGVFAAVPDDALFDDPSPIDGGNPLRVGVSSTPYGVDGRPEWQFDPKTGDQAIIYTLGQVFDKGQMLRQWPNVASVRAQKDAWCFDAASGEVLVHLSSGARPVAYVLELTVRRRVFAPHHRGLGFIHVIGFVIERCGNQFPRNFWEVRANAQAGALSTRSGHHWLIRDNLVRDANTIGIDVGSEGFDNESANEPEPARGSVGFHVVENNRVTDNGACGIASFHAGNCVLKGNVVERNNALHFTGYKRFEQAGIKLLISENAEITGNLVRNNDCAGIYIDGGRYAGTRIARNVITGNDEFGIHIEMGDLPPDAVRIDNNAIVGNRGSAVYVNDASGLTLTRNLLANSSQRAYVNGTGLTIRLDSVRNGQATVKNHAWFGNIFAGNVAEIDVPYPSRWAEGRRADGNLYGSGSKSADSARRWLINRFAGVPPEPFVDLVARVGTALGEPATADDKRCRLTLPQWRALLRANRAAPNEVRSLAMDGVTVQWDDPTLRLTMELPTDPALVGGMPAAGDERDLLGVALPPNGQAKPGPFQALKQGRNAFTVWTGLQSLPQGALPPGALP